MKSGFSVRGGDRGHLDTDKRAVSRIEFTAAGLPLEQEATATRSGLDKKDSVERTNNGSSAMTHMVPFVITTQRASTVQGPASAPLASTLGRPS